VPPVDRQARPVVLEHRPDYPGIADRAAQLVVVFPAHCLRVGAVPGFRVGVNNALRDLGLGEEEPVPPLRGELRADPGQVLADGQAVEQCQPGDRLGVVECQP
jgi:hypothetical protein